jgi:hypothetical protein
LETSRNSMYGRLTFSGILISSQLRVQRLSGAALLLLQLFEGIQIAEDGA